MADAPDTEREEPGRYLIDVRRTFPSPDGRKSGGVWAFGWDRNRRSFFGDLRQRGDIVERCGRLGPPIRSVGQLSERIGEPIPHRLAWGLNSDAGLLPGQSIHGGQQLAGPREVHHAAHWTPGPGWYWLAGWDPDMRTFWAEHHVNPSDGLPFMIVSIGIDPNEIQTTHDLQLQTEWAVHDDIAAALTDEAQQNDPAGRDIHPEAQVSGDDLAPGEPFMRAPGDDRPVPTGWLAEGITTYHDRDIDVVYDPRRHEVLIVKGKAGEYKMLDSLEQGRWKPHAVEGDAWFCTRSRNESAWLSLEHHAATAQPEPPAAEPDGLGL